VLSKDEQERLKDLLLKANQFRRFQLLVRVALSPWRRLVEQAQLNRCKAITFHEDNLLQSSWDAWLGYAVARRTERVRREHRLMKVAASHHK
jgi:hypothetical protein